MAVNYDQLLTKTLEHVQETGTVTQADIFVISLCRKSQSKTRQSPLKQFVQDAQDILPIVTPFIKGD